MLPKSGGFQWHSAAFGEPLAGITFVTIRVFNTSVPSNSTLFWCPTVACRIIFGCIFQLKHVFFARTFQKQDFFQLLFSLQNCSLVRANKVDADISRIIADISVPL